MRIWTKGDRRARIGGKARFRKVLVTKNGASERTDFAMTWKRSAAAIDGVKEGAELYCSSSFSPLSLRAAGFAQLGAFRFVSIFCEVGQVRKECFRLPHEQMTAQRLLLIGLSLFGGYGCKCSKQAIGFAVRTGRKKQCSGGARASIVAEAKSPQSVDF